MCLNRVCGVRWYQLVCIHNTEYSIGWWQFRNHLNFLLLVCWTGLIKMGQIRCSVIYIERVPVRGNEMFPIPGPNTPE